MNLQRHPLRINAGFLLNAPYGYSRDIHFDLPKIQFEEDIYTDFKGTVRVSRTPQGILVQSEFQAETILECVRCLTEIKQPLHCEFYDLYAFKNRSTTESDLLLPEDATIDLEPLVREYLLIEIPISPVCQADCKGLCIECGENLNLGACEHSVRAIE